MIDVKTANVLFIEGKYAEAAEMYSLGASEGDAECAFNYGYCLYRGIGVEKNRELAKSYFVFSSEVIPEASYNLAVMYLYGEGVTRDFIKSARFMRDAAAKGVIEAQLYMGVAHTLGDLFEPDIAFLSRIPYHKPEYRTEETMLLGEITPEEFEKEEQKRMRAVRFDPQAAFFWFKRAADHSPDYVEELSHKSKYLYARCFLDGLGTDFDRDRANSLMLAAAADGSPEALYYLETDAPYVLAQLKDKELLGRINELRALTAPK